ncbi:FUSC family protein [Aneurinibacillus uraniidurans]|uniref:FUSC family protein n=1 Tax=Aneurinibacillus uraniidurans TaxID=2966586 RepID=UPI002349D572|nr:FUSC family protein [Aneurinibacillus sp. B1]WCN36276.1 FUSC family protein [Aneurinibacillus sp. B1]
MSKRLLCYVQQTSIIWKMALASTISWELAKLAGSKHPYLAPLTVILCLQPTLDKSVQFTYQRILGTIVGVLLTIFIAPYLGEATGWSIGLLILVTTGIAKWVHVQEQVIKQILLSVLLVFFFQNQSPAYAFDRIKDTLIGAIVVVLINLLIFPPDLTKKALHSMQKFANDLAERFSRVAKWVEHGCVVEGGNHLQSDAQKLLDELTQTITNLKQASEDLRYQLFARKSRILFDQQNNQLVHLCQGYVHLTGMIRTLMEWSNDGNMTRENQTVWASYLHDIAAYIKDWEEKMNTGFSSLGNPPLPSALPMELEHYRHHLALYNDMMQIIEDFK